MDVVSRLAKLTPEQRSRLFKTLSTTDPEPEGTNGAGALASYPLAPSQRRLWFLDRLDLGNPAFVIPYALAVRGDLNVGRLEAALAQLVLRHSVLRTRFIETDGVPQQMVERGYEPMVERFDEAEGDYEHRLANALLRFGGEARKPFNLDKLPLFRVALYSLGPSDHLLGIVIHHIIADGVSMQVLLDDLVELYNVGGGADSAGMSVLRPEYRHYASRQAARIWDDADPHLSYWRRQFTPLPPYLDLPTDWDRPPIQSYRGRTVPVNVGKDAVDGLGRWAAANGATGFMALMEGFVILLHKLSAQTDIVVGFPVANRCGAAEEALMGFFVNTLPLRATVSGDPTVLGLLRHVRARTLEAYDHQTVPFDVLVDKLAPPRDLGRPMLRQATFAYQDLATSGESFEGTVITPLHVDNGTCRVDLSLIAFNHGGNLSFALEYNADLFKEESVRGFAVQLEEIWAAMLSNPGIRLSEMPEPSRHKREPDEETTVPLSERQTLFHLSQQLHDGNLLYFDWIRFRFAINGKLDWERFQVAYRQLLLSSDALRGRITQSGGVPSLTVSDALPDSIAYRDLSRERDPHTSAQAALSGFLASVPDTGERLCESMLLKLDEECYWWLLSVSHVVNDGWSNAEIVSRMSRIYQGSEAYSQPSYEFTGYLKRIQEEALTEERIKCSKYWQEQLARKIDLPRFYGGTHQQPSTAAAQIAFPLGPGRSSALRNVLQELGIYSPAVAFIGLMAILIARTNRLRAVRIGAAFNNRSSAEQRLIGLFLAILPIEVETRDGESFIALFRRVQTKMIEASRYKDHAVGNPLDQKVYDVYFNFQNVQYREFGGFPLSGELLHNGHTNVAFALQVQDFDAKGEYTLDFDFNKAAFPDRHREASVAHYDALLSAFLAEPTASYDHADLVLTAERQRLLSDFNRTQRAFSAPVCLDQWLASQAAITPLATALVFGEEEMSYAQLHERADHLAASLRELGVGPGELVAVCMVRSLELVIALVGITKAGGAYVPIDPSLPDARVAYMLSDANPRAILVDELGRRCVIAANEDVLTNSRLVSVAEALCRARPASCPTAATVSGEDLAYVIYTSGSTGKPKGAMLRHAGVCNRLAWMQAAYGIGPGDRVIQKTPYSFDVSVWELFWPLVTGATLVIAKPEGHKDPLYLAALIQEGRVNVIHFVPSMLAVFLEYEEAAQCTGLQKVFCSGEALSVKVKERFFAALPGCELHNLYGPTEASVDVSYWECKPGGDSETIPIGFPIANIHLYVFDPLSQLVPIGAPGELCISGIGVAKGYLNRPELTAERFVRNPYSEGDPSHAILYRTGDLARYRDDGSLEYLGRIDHQVKIRGFRIELGEIEAAVVAYPAIAEAAVVVRDLGNGEPSLICFTVASSGESVNESALREHLQNHLPSYMVPSRFVALLRMPTTHNGKLDRDALPTPSPDLTQATQNAHVVLRPGEARLARVWESVLGVPVKDVNANFFSLGGHSLMAVMLVARIRDEFVVTLPLVTIFRFPTLAELAREIHQRGDMARECSELLVALRGDGSKPTLVLVHPAGGQLLCYQGLIEAFPEGCDLLGLQSRVVGGAEEYTSLDAMLEHYAQALTENVAAPYLLVGWSIGGLVAHALASVLEARGHEVRKVILIDSHVDNAKSLIVRGDPLLEAVALIGGQLAGVIAEMQKDDLARLRSQIEGYSTVKQRVTEVLRWAVDQGWLRSDEQLLQNMLFSADAALAHVEMIERHPLGRIKSSLVALWASESPLAKDASLWRDSTAGEFSELTIPGNHFSILTPPLVAHLAKTLMAQALCG